MRSFEAAAIGGCILAEDTADHQELFGPNDHAVRYFKTNVRDAAASKTPSSGSASAPTPFGRLRERFGVGKHTYADRLGRC